jgi:hypothetical protein
MRGLFVSLELKSEKGKLAPLQDYLRKRINRAGGVALVANPQNWEEAKALLLQLDQGVKNENDV